MNNSNTEQYILCNIYIYILQFWCTMFHLWLSWGVPCNSCANTFEILEIPQENFIGPLNPQNHRVQRNFSAGFTAFLLYVYLLYGELSSRKWFTERNKEKKRPDGNRGAKRLILSLSRYFWFLPFLELPDRTRAAFASRAYFTGQMAFGQQ